LVEFNGFHEPAGPVWVNGASVSIDSTEKPLLAPHIILAHSSAKLFTALTESASRSPFFSPTALHRNGFTPREAEVLEWLIEGKRNNEIAVILNASPRTIAKHVEHIFAKLGVETRTAAAARAMEILRAG
jgi:DNA-binding CsgD family transcriptional regulator